VAKLGEASSKHRAVACAIVVVHVMLVAWGAWSHSPTIDEPAYLAAGISHWEYGRFDLYKVSPPLVRLVAGAAVLGASPELDWRNYRVAPWLRYESVVGDDFVAANGPRSLWLFTLGRWACLPFTLIGAWVMYRWGMALWGPTAAVAALAIWCYSPNILAHAQLLTPDIGVTSLCLASCYAFWHWSQSPGWLRATVAGITLGSSVLAKTNAVALFPALALAVGINAVFEARLRDRRTWAQFAVAFALAIYTINLGYAFEGSLRRLDQYDFFSKAFTDNNSKNRFRDSVIGPVPVPLPAAFLEGVDLQRRDFENEGGYMKTYLRGRWYDHGWWWYYFYVVAVKVPTGLVIAGFLGAAMLFKNGRPVRIACVCYVILPGVLLFVLACSQTGFGHSLRYVLPAFPFAFLLATTSTAPSTPPLARAIGALALTWAVSSSLAVYPHSLSYFNELSGGPRNGSFHLLDGNVDWGQDLLHIRDWIDSHPNAKPVYVAFWGLRSANRLGIEINLPCLEEGKSPPPGWYLVSVNHLRNEFRRGLPELGRFLADEPVEEVTPAIRVYFVAGPSLSH
jgi:dolichyl-phosphate-mannose-protein mannosyltransferase